MAYEAIERILACLSDRILSRYSIYRKSPLALTLTFIQRWKKRGIRMIERGTPLTSPELIRLSQKITRHGMVVLHLQNKFEKEELS